MLYFVFRKDDAGKYDLSALGEICLYATNILAVPIAFSLIFLTLNLVF